MAYWVVDSAAFITPSKGNKAMGNKAVAGIGIASVIHHVAMRTATAATLIAGAFISAGVGRMSIRMNNTGPRKKPILCLIE